VTLGVAAIVWWRVAPLRRAADRGTVAGGSR
jgi:hypothetical protein